MSNPPRLTHLDAGGRAQMVDVGHKPRVARRAVARAEVRMQPATTQAILDGSVPKGDVAAVARLAGISAAKRTSELILLCHPLPLDHVEVVVDVDPAGLVTITATAAIVARTGVEMEALTAVSVAALNVYDLVKAIDKGVVIGNIHLVEKTKGAAGPV
jgi:cyclic pyranopterin monophosphate synthase